MSTNKRRALIIISSTNRLPLVEPEDVGSISTGFFLVEMAQVLKEFETDYEFDFATPDGKRPQLNINGMGLAMHSAEEMGERIVALGTQQSDPSFDVEEFRQRNADLVARREQEVQLLERHMGRMSVSELLPASEPELAAYRPELVRRLDVQPQRTWHSLKDLVQRHRDASDAFTFADYDFIHAPGGHAPMVDFLNNPWLGETLHVARENGVTISLICHAPVGVTSTQQRIDAAGHAYQVADNPFLAATISVVPKEGEEMALSYGYVHIPGKTVRLSYFVDEAIKEAGFTVSFSLDPETAYEPSVRLLTGNGPAAVDMQTAELRRILTDSPAAH
ncbi:type 1 glutamine amidotransferase family protein [Streptomyces stackebrandtii]|uniref:hypothetical protein n=1 Tax=Streptomyces stackebrandtii TaxID=3051177 RepID=UPI0028DC76EC|nr:hypothetical protein [Streptomyces sp. DSM 40976]